MKKPSERASSPRQMVVNLHRRDTDHGREVGGSHRDTFNNLLVAQAISAQWTPTGGLTPDEHERQAEATIIGIAAFKPRDAVEAMMAAQAMALHAMSMECARKAQLSAQPHEIAQGMRKSAISASRMFAEIVDTLDRHRGKHRRQTVRVERVNVEAGAQAVVGIANAGGRGGEQSGIEGEAHAQRAGLADINADGVGVPKMRGADPERQPVPRPGDGERPMPDARRQKHRAKPGGA